MDELVVKRLERFTNTQAKDFRREADHYMIGGMVTKLHGIQAYLKQVEERVETNPPPINLASIVREYYTSPPYKSVSNTFRLQHIAKSLKEDPRPQLSYNYCSPPNRSKPSPIKVEPRKRGEFECRYDLNSYSLKQVKKAFQVYTQTLETLKTGEAMLDKYSEAKAREKIDLSDKTILARMATEDSPASKEVVTLLKNPYFMALVKLIELYNRFNPDTDVKHLSKLY